MSRNGRDAGRRDAFAKAYSCGKDGNPPAFWCDAVGACIDSLAEIHLHPLPGTSCVHQRALREACIGGRVIAHVLRRTFMQAMHQVWRPSGPLGSRLNCAIFFSARQCTQTRSAGPSVLLRFDGRSSCRHSKPAQRLYACVADKI